MKAGYVPRFEIEAVLEPESALWRGVRMEPVKLMGTPLGLQPTEAIRMSWMHRPVGAVEEVGVSMLHDGRSMAFRLEWRDANEDRVIGDTTAFVDAAALLLPSVVGASSVTMGAPTLPVNAWYWRADEDGRGREMVAEGIGTTRPVAGDQVRGHGSWKEGRWRVVITRSLRVATPEPVAQLEVGQATGFAVAIWEGSRGERAGLKAFSGDWLELRIEAPPTARK